MPNTVVAELHAWLNAHEEALLGDAVKMLQIPSVESDPAPNAPFGIDNRTALDFALEMGKSAGMRVKDLDGYCGYAEFGEGPLILVLGHLDVVPVGPGWKHEPFSATLDGGYIYARGAVDDKGPTMAAFYASRAIKESCPELGARIRVVFGCNEESGFKCVKRYADTEEMPYFGVAPDSGWPLYHAEKGIANFVVDVPLASRGLSLRHVSGGQRPNIVIDRCEAILEVAPEAKAEFSEKLAKSWDRNVVHQFDGERLTVSAIGKASHGSEPYYGDSAAIRLFRFLFEVAPLADEGFYRELLELAHIGGVGLGIEGADTVSHELTCNLGIVETHGDKARLTLNVRYPVTWKFDEMLARCRARLAKSEAGFELFSTSDSPSLYFPLDHPLVKIICDAYKVETGDDKAPGVMGGGTYARAIPNTVSIGTGWDGDGKAHETDERLKVENLFKMSRIYAHILYNLANEAAKQA